MRREISDGWKYYVLALGGKEGIYDIAIRNDLIIQSRPFHHVYRYEESSRR